MGTVLSLFLDFACSRALTVYNFSDLRFRDGFAMFLASRWDVRRCRNWRAALVLVAICALSVSLATRYTVLNSDVTGVKVVKSQSSDAKRQHLVRDALKWTAPAAKFTLVPAVQSHVHVVSAIFPATNLSSESWLYNRPPPSC
jgi:hypothetical protein